MVAGELCDPVVADHVNPAVTGVGQMRVLIRKRQCRAGRAHSATMAVSLGATDDRVICLDDRHFQSLVDAEIRSESAEETLAYGLSGQLAGDLAAGCSAQTIGDHQQMTPVPFIADVNHRVLIFPPLPSCVSAMSYDDLIVHDLSSKSRLRNPLRRDEGQISVTDANLVVTLKWMGFGDLPPVDEGAVAREIVFDQAAPVAINDDRVRPADGLVFEHDVADGIGADPVVSGVNAEVFAVGVVAVRDQPADDPPFGLTQL